MFSAHMDYIWHQCDADEKVPCSNPDHSAEYWQGNASGLCQDQSARIDPYQMPDDEMQVDSYQFGNLAFTLRQCYTHFERRYKEIEKRIEEIRKGFIRQQALVEEMTSEIGDMIKSQAEADARSDSQLRWPQIGLAANVESGYKKAFLPGKASVYILPRRPTRRRKRSNTNHDTDMREHKRCRYI